MLSLKEGGKPLATFKGENKGTIYFTDKIDENREPNVDILRNVDEINALLDDYGIERQEFQIIIELLRQNKKIPPSSSKPLRKAYRKVRNYIIRKNAREITFPE